MNEKWDNFVEEANFMAEGQANAQTNKPASQQVARRMMNCLA